MALLKAKSGKRDRIYLGFLFRSDAIVKRNIKSDVMPNDR